MKKIKNSHLTVLSILLGCILILTLLSGCSTGENQIEKDPAYRSEVQNWQKQRLQGLKKPGSWLSLAGLFWLEEGQNTFGKAETNNHVVEIEGTPELIGIFTVKGHQIIFKSNTGIKVMHQDQPIKEITMTNDQEGTPTILQLNRLSW